MSIFQTNEIRELAQLLPNRVRSTYNLRQVMDYPGTGPFRHKKRVDKEVWVMERNPDYWNEGLPYLDGIEFYHLTAPGSRAGLLPPSPLRTARASFPACRSSLANAPCGTR